MQLQIGHYTAPIFLKQILYQISLAWTAWGEWSPCELIDPTEECGPNATQWRMAISCMQQSDETEVDEFWCGETVYHIQSCHFFCKGKNFDMKAFK